MTAAVSPLRDPSLPWGAVVPPPREYHLISGHLASPHQAAVFDAMGDPASGSKIVRAVAGSGKTTTMINALRYAPFGAHIQLLAFNTDAGAALKAGLTRLIELDGRPRYKNVRAGTFHSVCFNALCRLMGWKAAEIKPDRGKVKKLLKLRLTGEDYELYAPFVTKLVGYAKGDGIGILSRDTEDVWNDLIEHHGMYLDHEAAVETRAVEIARKALAFSSRIAKEKAYIDFDDQLYLTLLWGARLWTNDVVVLDEAQDSNPTRRAVARRLLKRSGRLFAVGDENQSIYGFTGATPDAMRIIARDFEATELPLTVSYRCCKAVVRVAQEWVPDMRSHEASPEGEVVYDVPFDEAVVRLTPDDLILCRRTAPLVDAAYKLIARGTACRVAGKQIGEDLVDLVRAQRARGIENLILKLEAFREREMARFIAKDEEELAEGVSDRVQSILTIVEHLPETERSIPGLIRRIEGLFKDTTEKVLTLMTQHRAKGLEAPTVAILRPDLNPGFARQDWQQQQETNLMYVAATRAKLTLMYLATGE